MARREAVKKGFFVGAAVRPDIPDIKRIETECGLSPWGLEDYYRELGNPASLFLVVKVADEIKGFILARLIMNETNPLIFNQLNFPASSALEISENEAEIYNLAIEEQSQKEGLGSFLLKAFFEEAIKRKVGKIFLEVRSSNLRAIAFYKKNMFSIIGRRKMFYGNPPEDAVLMSARPVN
jgi:[ribosomal protein S18]-alanine N-acetyltransferase